MKKVLLKVFVAAALIVGAYSMFDGNGTPPCNPRDPQCRVPLIK